MRIVETTTTTTTTTFTISESSADFISTYIPTAGGAFSVFDGSGLTSTTTFTPINNSNTFENINVIAGSSTDNADTNNTASNKITISADRTKLKKLIQVL